MVKVDGLIYKLWFLGMRESNGLKVVMENKEFIFLVFGFDLGKVGEKKVSIWEFSRGRVFKEVRKFFRGKVGIVGNIVVIYLEF